MPSELRQPDVVLRIDLDVLALGEGDYAIVAEAVPVYGQVVFGPVIHLDVALAHKAKRSAYIVWFDDGPAGQAGADINIGRILYAMRDIGDKPRKVALATSSFCLALLHRHPFFVGLAAPSRATAPIIG